MLPIESVIELCSFRVNLIKNHICITLVACCEYDDFPLLLHLLEEGDGIGSNIEAYLKRKAIDINGQFDIWLTLIL